MYPINVYKFLLICENPYRKKARKKIANCNFNNVLLSQKLRVETGGNSCGPYDCAIRRAFHFLEGVDPKADANGLPIDV